MVNYKSVFAAEVGTATPALLANLVNDLQIAQGILVVTQTLRLLRKGDADIFQLLPGCFPVLELCFQVFLAVPYSRTLCAAWTGLIPVASLFLAAAKGAADLSLPRSVSLLKVWLYSVRYLLLKNDSVLCQQI